LKNQREQAWRNVVLSTCFEIRPTSQQASLSTTENEVELSSGNMFHTFWIGSESKFGQFIDLIFHDPV